MSNAAGNVQILLNVNKTSYTAAFQEAQRELDKFAGKTKEAGHATVSSMQASSAAIRELNGDFTRNTRAVERFITTIPGVGKVLQAAFPLIGGVAFGSMLFELGSKVKDFIDKANAMPAAIKQGFESLHLASMSSNDALKLTNDQLQNHINKLQGKPQNNLAIQLDEARIKANDLAKSLEEDAKRVDDLLSRNKISNLMSLLTGKGSSVNVSGSVQYGMQEIQHLGYLVRQAAGTPGEAKALQDLAAKQAYYQRWINTTRFFIDHPEYQTNETGYYNGDPTANHNILTGFQDVLGDQITRQSEKDRNARLVPQNQAAEANKTAAEKSAQEFRQLLELDGELWQKAQELARQMAEFTTQYVDEMVKSQGLSSSDNKQLDDQGKSANAYIQSLRQAIDLQKENSAALAESSIQMAVATGQMTRLDAAQAMANLHTQDYNAALQQLQDQREAIQNSSQYDNDPLARKAALQDNQNRIDALNASRGIQVAQDNQSTNPAASSGLVGAADALNEFMAASRDAFTQMRDLTNNILGSLNDQFVRALSGQRTDFSNMGAGIFRNVAGIGLKSAEGSILSAVSGGKFGSKLGTQSNPMYVRIADAVSSATGSLGGFLSKLFGGGSTGPGASGLANVLNQSTAAYNNNDQAGGGIGSVASAALGLIPFLASGGPINGPAIVGEQGPELFVPSTSGHIIPNHQLSSITNTGHTINIDATGSTDPAQVEAAVQRGIAAAAPHIMAGSVHAMRERQKRRPGMSR